MHLVDPDGTIFKGTIFECVDLDVVGFSWLAGIEEFHAYGVSVGIGTNIGIEGQRRWRTGRRF